MFKNAMFKNFKRVLKISLGNQIEYFKFSNFVLIIFIIFNFHLEVFTFCLNPFQDYFKA